ncbi:hypothetical protein HDF15_004404 [Granulicella mallensis]|uniref:Uncharacterized protein n=1 Tax=Granulicella mallensis TaxID=940614 RepID=A0A7W8EBY1_9BACT|nr:hypothetical protein [Granulicella mallensis]
MRGAKFRKVLGDVWKEYRSPLDIVNRGVGLIVS